MVCSFCGSVINDEDKFCMVCGNAVNALNEAAADKADGAPAGGAYFTDQANAPQPEAAPAPSYTQQVYNRPDGQPVYGQPVFTSPDGQPVYAQPMYTAPDGQPVYAQPVYATPDGQPVYAQPVYATPDGQPVYAQPVYATTEGQPVYAQPAYTSPDGQHIYAQPVYAQPMYGQQMGSLNPAAASLAQNTMIMGIIAVCAAFSWFLSPGGIVLGAMALSKSNEYLRQFGPLPTKGKVGRHLGRAGLIAGIVVSVFLLFAIFAYIVDQM